MAEFNSKQYLNTVRDWLSKAAIIWVSLVFAGYFLITTRQGSAIPTYFLALTGLVGLAASPGLLLLLLRSWTFVLTASLLTYIALSMSWLPLDTSSTKVWAGGTDVIVLLFAATAFAVVRREVNLAGEALKWLLVGATLSASILLLIEVGGFNLDYLGSWNVRNVASIAFGFVFLVSVSYAMQYKDRLNSIGYAAASLFSLAAVLLLESPVVFFGLLAALTAVSFAALWETRYQRMSLLWVGLSAVLMILVLQVFGSLIEEQRSAIWASTVDKIFENSLFFGVGYSVQPLPLGNCSLGGECQYQHPHNLFVSTIHQLGLVGFLLLFTLYLVALSSLFERKSPNRWALGGCLFYSAAVFMFDGQQLVANMNFVWLIFWLPIFLVIREEFLHESSD
jgi:hypothetical protein